VSIKTPTRWSLCLMIAIKIDYPHQNIKKEISDVVLGVYTRPNDDRP